jgi:hypothetical protein
MGSFEVICKFELYVFLLQFCRYDVEFFGHLGNFLFLIKRSSDLQSFIVCLSVKLNLVVDFLGPV